jgi:phosphoribosylamine-glycine ligase
MKLLVIGSGGREHALAWKLLQSPRVSHVFVAPGNGGTATMAGSTNVALNDPAALADFVKKSRVIDSCNKIVSNELQTDGRLTFALTTTETAIATSAVWAT